MPADRQMGDVGVNHIKLALTVVSAGTGVGVSSSAFGGSTEAGRGPVGAPLGPPGRMIARRGPVGGALLGPVGALLPLIDLRGEAKRALAILPASVWVQLSVRIPPFLSRKRELEATCD